MIKKYPALQNTYQNSIHLSTKIYEFIQNLRIFFLWKNPYKKNANYGKINDDKWMFSFSPIDRAILEVLH